MKLNKSIIGLLGIILVLLTIISAMIYKDFSNDNRKSDKPIELSTLTEDATNKPLDTDSQTQNIFRNYTMAVELDKECESRLSNAQSNFEITEINLEFADKWKLEINTNYQKLLEIANSSFKEKLMASQKEWYINAEKHAEERLRYLEELYQGGTIVPIKASAFQRDLYRERAIELFDMYYELTAIEEDMVQ